MNSPTSILLLFAVVVASCSTHTSELERAINQTAQEQSVGLDGASVKFFSVKETESLAWMKLDESDMLVEVDVEFDKFQKGFDLDDIEILDALSGKNYGSDPFVSYESDEDEVAKEFGNGPTRVTLLYIVPSSTNAVGFIYWGKSLNDEPLVLERLE